MNKVISWNHSIPNVWFASYLLVLVIPLVVSVAVYKCAESITKKNIETFSHQNLTQVADSLNRAFVDVHSVGQQILTLPSLESLEYTEMPLTNIKREKIQELESYMNTAVAHNQYITDIYIIFSRPGFIVSTNGYIDDKKLFDQVLQNRFGLTYSELKVGRPKSDFSVHLGGSNNRAQYLSARLGSPAISESQDDVVILFSINVNQFQEILSSQMSQNGSSCKYWTVAADGKIFSSDASEALAQKVSSKLPGLSQSVQENLSGKDYILTAVTLPQTDWNVVSATPVAEYTSDLKVIRGGYLLYLIGCIIFGILISIYFVNRNYAPIRKLQAKLRRDNTENRTDFSQIEAGLDNLLDQSQNYEKEIDRQKKLIRQDVLSSLLRNPSRTDEVLQKTCGEYDITFSAMQFTIAGILIRDYSGLLTEERPEQDDETFQLAAFAVTSVTQELLQELCDCYMCQIDSILYIVITPKHSLSPLESDDFQKNLHGVLERAGAFSQERLGIQLNFYMSRLHGDGSSIAQNLHLGYLEVQWGMEQIEGFQLKVPVLNYEELENLINIPHNFDVAGSISQKHRFCVTVYEGNLEEANKLYCKLQNMGQFQTDKSFSNTRIQTIFLVNELISQSRLIEQESFAHEIAKYVNQIFKANNMTELTQIMQEVSLFVYRSVRKPQKSAANVDFGGKVAQYIKDHYSDPNLNVSSIADSFGFSQSYLLRMFKPNSGMCVLDYIRQCRVNAAKPLLRDTDETQEYIARKVGFTNSLAMNRAFKHLEGITPAMFRTLNR